MKAGLLGMVADLMAGKPVVRRSSKWPKLCKEVIDAHPFCMVCGNRNRKNLIGHHRQSFHEHPELELVRSNIAVICENGPGRLNCHLVVGHTGDFRQINEHLDADAEYVGKMLARK